MTEYRDGKTSGLSREIAITGLRQLNETVKAKIGTRQWEKPRHWSKLEDALDAAVAAGDATRTTDAMERYMEAVRSWEPSQTKQKESEDANWD